jgi:hypothetical protein
VPCIGTVALRVRQHEFADRAKAIQLPGGLTAKEVDQCTWSGPAIIHAFALPASTGPETRPGRTRPDGAWVLSLASGFPSSEFG